MAIALLISGCGRPPVTETGEAGLERFPTELSFKRYLADRVDAERPSLWWLGLGAASGFSAADAPAAMDIPDSADQRPAPLDESALDDFSTTNIQEEGVDESDVVKNDGTYIYVIERGTLRIVRAIPADDMAVLSTIELPGTFDQAYLRGDTLVAIGTDYDSELHESVTVAAVVDLADRAEPSVRATIRAEGSLTTSRMIGSKLHLVLSARPRVASSQSRTSLVQSSIEELIPDLTVAIGAGEPVARDLVAWDDFYRPMDPDGYGVTAVVTVDVDAPDEPHRSVAVMADAGTVYASLNALYLTDTEYAGGGQLRETTDIYRIDLTDNGPAFVGAGSIPGRLLNRFSLGEHGGFLRTATTIGNVSRSGENTARNNVYVLGREGDALAVVGKVENIAPGERIYSARFVGERGFLVTFKKVDPLFTLDLRDPTEPRVVGELKVPGYSDYIHPLGENHLLTIGKDSVDMGDFAWYQGVQLSVFDVTDFANPVRIDVEVVGDRGTESEALYDPHAFNYFAPQDMLAVPMTIAEGAEEEEPSSYGTPTFHGLCLFRVTAQEGIEPLARIPAGSTSEQQGDLWSWRWSWSSPWNRGVFIGDYLYSVTPTEIRAMRVDPIGGEQFELALE